MAMDGLSYTDTAKLALEDKNKYLYNGKELQNDKFSDGSSLDWYDYGARFYDAALGRFFTQDRFAEKYHFMSPYQYGANNPIKFIDFNGDSLQLNGAAAQLYFEYIQKGFGKYYTANFDKKSGLLIVGTTDISDDAPDDIKAFYNAINGAADLESSMVAVNIETNGDYTLDSYEKSSMDIFQLMEFDKKDITITSPQALIAHFVVEQTGFQRRGSSDYDTDHNNGRASETLINKGYEPAVNSRPGQNAQLIGEILDNGNIRGRITGTMYRDYKNPICPARCMTNLSMDLNEDRIVNVNQNILIK
jgi:RHS repeat-associated protein